jgi:hypothetical protein
MMRRAAFAIALLSLTQLGCKSDEVVEVVNTWQLDAILADPGDGSGQFESVNSDKQIEFFEDETYTCNGSLCMLGGETTQTTTGTFSDIDSTIVASGCGVNLPFRFE